MKVSQSAVYAIHAVLLLAGAEDASPVSCAELAREGAMPHRFLLQILRDLAKNGIVRPTRGGGGGFALERAPAEISLLEVIEAIDGSLVPSRLDLGNLLPRIAQRIQDTLNGVFEICRGQLRDIRLSDLLARPAERDVAVGPGPAV